MTTATVLPVCLSGYFRKITSEENQVTHLNKNKTSFIYNVCNDSDKTSSAIYMKDTLKFKYIIVRNNNIPCIINLHEKIHMILVIMSFTPKQDHSTLFSSYQTSFTMISTDK